MTMKPIRIPLFLFFGLLSVAALAQAVTPSGSIELQAVAQQQKVTVDKDGTRHTAMVPAARVLPGTEVTYIINYTNVGTKPVESVVVNDPIPEHMTYVPGSVKGDNTTIAFSADGGKTWASSPSALTVTNPDGSTRPATPKDYTHIRWTVNGALAAGARGSVSFRATLQ
jgi:uncharacterized repeat protein (TIGR01451 family)